MQPWASHFRFPGLSFSICLVGIPSLQLMRLLWARKEVREARWVCAGVDPERPTCLPATGLALCPEGEGRSRVAGWTPHPPESGQVGRLASTWCSACSIWAEPWGTGLSAARPDSAPRRAPTEGRGRGVPPFQGQEERVTAGNSGSAYQPSSPPS